MSTDKRMKCPNCGRITIDVRRYPKETFDLYVHAGEVRKGPFPMYFITDSCHVEKEVK